MFVRRRQAPLVGQFLIQVGIRKIQSCGRALIDRRCFWLAITTAAASLRTDSAATKIQSVFRMYHARSSVMEFQHRRRAVGTIERAVLRLSARQRAAKLEAELRMAQRALKRSLTAGNVTTEEWGRRTKLIGLERWFRSEYQDMADRCRRATSVMVVATACAHKGTDAVLRSLTAGDGGGEGNSVGGSRKTAMPPLVLRSLSLLTRAAQGAAGQGADAFSNSPPSVARPSRSSPRKAINNDDGSVASPTKRAHDTSGGIHGDTSSLSVASSHHGRAPNHHGLVASGPSTTTSGRVGNSGGWLRATPLTSLRPVPQRRRMQLSRLMLEQHETRHRFGWLHATELHERFFIVSVALLAEGQLRRGGETQITDHTPLGRASDDGSQRPSSSGAAALDPEQHDHHAAGDDDLFASDAHDGSSALLLKTSSIVDARRDGQPPAELVEEEAHYQTTLQQAKVKAAKAVADFELAASAELLNAQDRIAEAQAELRATMRRSVDVAVAKAHADLLARRAETLQAAVVIVQSYLRAAASVDVAACVVSSLLGRIAMLQLRSQQDDDALQLIAECAMADVAASPKTL